MNINIFLIILLIHYVYVIIFKPKFNTLNCGIFGWAGKNVKNFNKDKVDKLGFFNVERGKSSCGISYDGDVFIGMNSRKLYYDFIVDENIILEKYPVFIGHTRQASVGTTVTIHNAHPFAFGLTDKGDYEFIGCHNGTLYNKEELANTFTVDLLANYKEYNHVKKEDEIKNREKIDSEILLECIYKSKNFKVLSDYLGGAALMFTNTNEPNVVYLFKGKSKMHSYSKDETEERPLYVYIENKNSMYVSSIENALRTIGGNDDNIIDIECNVVYKIINGDFLNAEKINISRKNAQQTSRPLNNKSCVHHHGYPVDFFDDDYYGDVFDNKTVNTNVKFTNNLLPPVKSNLNISNIQSKLNIYNEKTIMSQKDYRSSIYFHKLRFCRNGHPITGIYTFILGFGYYHLSESIKRAEELFWNYLDKPFDKSTGQFVDIITNENCIIPFRSENVLEPTLFYFVEGIHVRTALDYSVAYSKWTKLDKNQWLNYVDMSLISTHPVINISVKNKEDDSQHVIFNSIIYSGTIVPLGSDKKYTFEKGNLIKEEISSYYKNFIQPEIIINKELKKSEDKTEKNIIKLSEVCENISEQNDEIVLNNMIQKEEEETQLINEIINEDFGEPMQDFQKTRIKLLEFSENNHAIKVINFIDNTLQTITKLIK